MFKRDEGTLDRIVRLALATVLLPAGLFQLGGLQSSLGGLFLVGTGGLACSKASQGRCAVHALWLPALELKKQSVKKDFCWKQAPARSILQGVFNMRLNLFRTVCAAVAFAAGAVVIIINTLATVTNAITPISASDAIAFLAFGVAALGILGLQRA